MQTPPLSERALPLLSIAGLRRSFGEVDVLSGVDAEVRPGEAVAVVGPNGSGKSTLLRCVAGMDRPSAGSIQLNGRPMRERDPDTRRSVAAVLDDVEFFADLAVAEHLALLMSAHGDAAPDEHAASLLDEVGLSGAADQLPAGLSSGQRRRLALATCFARPRLLVLLDEPEQRLDSGGRRWLTGRLLAEKEAGHGVLFASHDRNLVKAVADRVVDLGRSVVTGEGQAAVPARVPLGRLRGDSRPRRIKRGLLMDIVPWAVPAAVGVALAIGAVRPLGRLLSEAGWAVPGAPGRLFAVAALLLLLGGLAQLLRSAGPVTASSAFWFWLLSAPVRRRDLLRRRYLVLLVATAVLVCVLAGLVACTGSVPVLPVVAAAALAAFALAGGAVCGQAWELADHVGQAVGQAMRAAGVLAFGSLATGVGRAGLNSVLHAPPDAAVILLAALAVAAAASCLLGYRALDRIDVSVLRRGQGLWTAGHAAAASMDVFMLTEFAADQRARQAGRVRPARMGAPFAGALARSEWARLRRRPYLAVRAAAAAVAWWGCRPVLHGPALAAVAVIVGYCLVLPVAGTLRQLTANPALRVQFAPRDRWLSLASLAVCLLASVTWTAIVEPGLGGGAALAAILSVGLTAAVYRTVTRQPLDYSGPLVPTPFGDYPLDLWRQVFRGTLLLAVLIAVAAAITARLTVASRPAGLRVWSLRAEGA